MKSRWKNWNEKTKNFENKSFLTFANISNRICLVLVCIVIECFPSKNFHFLQKENSLCEWQHNVLLYFYYLCKQVNFISVSINVLNEEMSSNYSISLEINSNNNNKTYLFYISNIFDLDYWMQNLCIHLWALV